MKDRFGIATGTFQHLYGDFRAIEIAKEIGADCVDFSLDSRTCENPEHIYSKGDAEIRAYYQRVREYADSLGMTIAQTHGRFGQFKNDPVADKAYIENSRIDCMVTAILGAPVSVVHNIDLEPHIEPSVHYEVGLNRFAFLMPFAKEYGVKIATETFGDNPKWGANCFFGNLDDYLKFYEIVKSTGDNADYFTMCMDTGHTNKASRFPGNPSVGDWIRTCKGEITVLHLHDNNSVDDEHKVPYCGTIDWKDVMEALDETGYSGVYNLEVSPSHFGPDFQIQEEEFAVKILKNIRSHYGKRNLAE